MIKFLLLCHNSTGGALNVKSGLNSNSGKLYFVTCDGSGL